MSSIRAANTYPQRSDVITPTLDTNATTAGDVLCAPFEITGVDFSRNFIRGFINGIWLLDKSDQGAQLDLVLFNSSTASLGTAGSAISISDADAEKIMAVINIQVGDYTDLVGSQLANFSFIERFSLIGSEKVLYGQLVDRTGGKTYAADGIQLRLLFDA